jgi:hypothetical protein
MLQNASVPELFVAYQCLVVAVLSCAGRWLGGGSSVTDQPVGAWQLQCFKQQGCVRNALMSESLNTHTLYTPCTKAHDCVRGANIFGVALLADAIINGRSHNQWAQYPQYLWDLDPIAGFRWYDTRVETILSNVTFMNYVYQPTLGAIRQVGPLADNLVGLYQINVIHS